MVKDKIECFSISLDTPLNLAANLDRRANDFMPVPGQPWQPNLLEMATYPTQHG